MVSLRFTQIEAPDNRMRPVLFFLGISLSDLQCRLPALSELNDVLFSYQANNGDAALIVTEDFNSAKFEGCAHRSRLHTNRSLFQLSANLALWRFKRLKLDFLVKLLD